MILYNITTYIHRIIMTLFISSKYVPEILSMKQQNQLIQYWKDTSNLIEINQSTKINIQHEV